METIATFQEYPLPLRRLNPHWCMDKEKHKGTKGKCVKSLNKLVTDSKAYLKSATAYERGIAHIYTTSCCFPALQEYALTGFSKKFIPLLKAAGGFSSLLGEKEFANIVSTWDRLLANAPRLVTPITVYHSSGLSMQSARQFFSPKYKPGHMYKRKLYTSTTISESMAMSVSSFKDAPGVVVKFRKAEWAKLKPVYEEMGLYKSEKIVPGYVLVKVKQTGCCVARIQLPVGFPALLLAQVSATASEQEVVLPRNTSFVFQGRTIWNKLHIWDYVAR